MKFSEFFDPWSTEHIRAFDVACKTGMWPIGFIPDGMEMGSFWFVTAITAISEAYCDVVLGRKNLIVVPPQDGGEPAAEPDPFVAVLEAFGNELARRVDELYASGDLTTNAMASLGGLIEWNASITEAKGEQKP